MHWGLKHAVVERAAGELADFAAGIIVHELGHFTVAALQRRNPRVGFSWTGVHVRHSQGTARQNACVAAAGPIAHTALVIWRTGRRHGRVQGILTGSVVIARQLVPVPGADGELIFGRLHEVLRARSYLGLGCTALMHAIRQNNGFSVLGLTPHLDAGIPLIRRAVFDIYFGAQVRKAVRDDDSI